MPENNPGHSHHPNGPHQPRQVDSFIRPKLPPAQSHIQPPHRPPVFNDVSRPLARRPQASQHLPLQPQGPRPLGPQPRPLTPIRPDTSPRVNTPVDGIPLPPPPTPLIPERPRPTPAPQPESPRKRRRWLVASALTLLVLVGGATTFLLTRPNPKPYNRDDALNAQAMVTKLTGDIETDITSLVQLYNYTASSSDATSPQGSFNNALSISQTDYKALKQSPVLVNQSANTGFKDFSDKWQDFTTYLSTAGNDMQKLRPVLVSFQTTTDQMPKSVPSDKAALSAYMESYRKLVDSTSTQIQSMTVNDSDNQLLLSALKQFLSSSASLLSKADSDLAANKPKDAQQDLQQIDADRANFFQSEAAVLKKMTTKAQTHDPTDTLNKLNEILQEVYKQATNGH